MAELVPPAEQPPLSIFLLDSRSPEDAGEVVSSALSDFDYRLYAVFDADGSIDVTIDRNELRTDALPDALFARGDAKRSLQSGQLFEAGGV